MKAKFSLTYCPVTQSEEYLHALTPDERTLIGPKATHKRVGDFIAGRVAAKSAVRTFLSLEDHVVPSILRTEEGEEAGKPYVQLENQLAQAVVSQPAVHVSITHADQKAYAVVSNSRIGIDNVTIEPYSHAFIDEVFQPEELQAWADWLGVAPQHPLAVCSGFAAKEALLKWLGVGLRYSLPMIQVIPVTKEESNQPSDYFQNQFRAVCLTRCNGEGQSNEMTLNGFFTIEASQVIIMLLGE